MPDEPKQVSGSPASDPTGGRLNRLTELLAVVLKDRNLRLSVKDLLSHLSQMKHLSPREFASRISDWKQGLLRLQAYYDSAGAVSDERLWAMYPDLLVRIAQESTRFQIQPKLILFTPVFKLAQPRLRETLQSVKDQIYGNFEFCLLTDENSDPSVIETAKHVFGDSGILKIRSIVDVERNLASLLNEVMADTQADFGGFVSAGDRLERAALFEVVKLINSHPDADVIYSDEAQNLGDYRARLFLKPGWSPDLFLSSDYLRNFVGFRISAVRACGGFSGFREDDIKFDLLLRLSEQTEEIHHLRAVIYHEQLPKPFDPGAPCHLESKKLALEKLLKRRGIAAEIAEGIFPGSFRVRRQILHEPKVSIVIPTKDRAGLLRQCIESIETRTAYKNYEILVVDNGSTETETLAYLATLSHEVLGYPGPFNFSAINNFAARAARGEHLLFLNDDTEVIAPEWLSAMIEHSQRAEVGAVGAKLLYPDGRIQHVGIGLERKHIALHLNRFREPWEHGYHGFTDSVRNLNAVTGACLMIKAKLFAEAGGFEESLPLTYNDVDLCLKMRARGYLNVYTPFALLYHHEGVSAKVAETIEVKSLESRRHRTYSIEVPQGQGEQVKLFYARWRAFIESDDYYVANELF